MYQFKNNKRHSAGGRNAGTKSAGKSKKVKSIQNELNEMFNRKSESEPIVENPFVPQCAISDLPLSPGIISNLEKRNFSHLTEIQEKSFDAILNGRNLMGIAQTGTGKTAAYLLPLIQNLIGTKADSQVLVIVPTRELAVQVEDEFKALSKNLGLYSINLIGGTSVRKNLSDLNRQYHVIIGTPGRLNDMERLKALKMHKFQTVVLDEFDRLLDMGFLNDILHMMDAAVNRNQTILLSATEEAGQKNIIGKLLHEPVEVRVSSGSKSADNVEQSSVKIRPGDDKFLVLKNMLMLDEFEKVIVFIETKHSVAKMCKKLMQEGIYTSEIHGDISQGRRLQAIKEFRNGKSKVLIATDIAARGLDINNVTHVINYELPRTMDSYIHRVGRTGRAGKKGKALTFIHSNA